MGITPVYRKASPNVISYGASDVAQGRSILTLYGAETISGSTFILSDSDIYSYYVTKIVTIGAGYTTNDAEVADLNTNYDMGFNIPAKVGGTAVTNITMGSNAGVTNHTCRNRVVINWNKWDGTNETFLISGQNVWTITGTQNVAVSRIMNVSADIPDTTFKAGEFLRMNVQIFALRNAVDTWNIGFGQDPKDRDDDSGTAKFTNAQTIESTHTTQLIAKVPFRIKS